MDERGLGKRLQLARQAAGLTQQQLCHKANLSFSTLTKIERGAIKAPSIFTVQAIADVLGSSLDDLIDGVIGVKRQLNKTKSGASFIYFDVNGCLVYFYQRAFEKIASDTGALPDTVETIFWRYNDEVCRGQLSLSDFNDKLAESLGVSSINWQEYYLEAAEPIQEMQELLIWTAQHYKVGLMTNIMPGFLSAMRRKGRLPAINYDAIIDSSEVGAIKPEAKVYEVASSRAGCPADEILLIDDSRANLMAASRLGWHTLWFDDSHALEMTERVKQTLEPGLKYI